MSIHSLALVSPKAELGCDVHVGPFCVIEEGVVVGDGCRLAPRVTLKAGIKLGQQNVIGEGAVLGGMPQHLHRPEHPGRLVIGDNNVIRENVTIHRAMKSEGETRIGNGCLLMVATHVAHDCTVGDHVVLTNNVMLAGHVQVGSRAYLGGGAAVHQFCRIGRLAMVGGMARVTQDVPPFVMIDGGSSLVVGLNRVGLQRAGVTSAEMQQLKSAYRTLYRSGLLWEPMLTQLSALFPVGPAAEFEPFLRATTRGMVSERRTPPRAVVRLVRDDAETGERPAVERKVG